eukprot:CAMPEP_0177597972 /NCGR_PEP_ID=MMETSP0419_2-20121207/12041_1 /TAXON_ID=582737 /ORGANISM="Tetraselmis sp., Strain GSL018" /LENGTH=487 /DNA_ID=CAMNT_0019090267 /DNA_START=145 /DNA_END=1608 /DNA_ORIENTATION=-
MVVTKSIFGPSRLGSETVLTCRCYEYRAIQHSQLVSTYDVFNSFWKQERTGGCPSKAAKMLAPRVARRNSVGCKASNHSNDYRVENVVIIGSGPAGYTAAIYAARAKLRPFVFEGVSAGGVRGGQLMTTTEVENFPGFPQGITGPDLMERMREQAERWGAALEAEDVEHVDLSARPFVVRSSERTVRAHAVVVATGAAAKRLNIPSEDRFWSNGISACAICDGASPLFRGGEVAVVGGGDTATEEAVYLTKYAERVHLLVRGPAMRASKTMQDRVLESGNITVHYNTAVVDACGDDSDRMTHLQVKDSVTGEERNLAVGGLFYGIGHKPNSAMLRGQIDLDEAGYVKVTQGVRTSVSGVFAAGDLVDTEWRQAVTAAGSGCQAAIAAERYLSAEKLAKLSTDTPKAARPKQQEREAVGGTDQETFNIFQTRHKGQYALRKLYHESDRLIVVLYTAPGCGPCRSLKPILSSLVSEYENSVSHLRSQVR